MIFGEIAQSHSQITDQNSDTEENIPYGVYS